jgi:hypothetical protein
MGVAELELAPPRSMNAAPQRSTRGAAIARHKAKRGLQADLARLLLAAGVPRPIPGDRVRASAHIVMPVARRRDEGNYRTALEKALGDALAPAPSKEERELGLEPLFRWLSDDTPEHFTFGSVTFGETGSDRVPRADGRGYRTVRRPALCIVRLVWGDDLVAELEAELEQLRAP